MEFDIKMDYTPQLTYLSQASLYVEGYKPSTFIVIQKFLPTFTIIPLCNTNSYIPVDSLLN